VVEGNALRIQATHDDREPWFPELSLKPETAQAKYIEDVFQVTF